MAYYINAPTLSAATAVFEDPAMTKCAPDGYYADGPIVRQQVDCVLLPPQECPFCGAECGCVFEGPVNKGVYYFSVYLGYDTGPVEVRFDPLDYPNGIEAIYDSTVYNTVVSPFFGPLSAPAGLPTFVGYDGDDCGIVSTHTLEEFEFRSSDNSFHDLGTTDVVNVLASQNQLTWSSPGACVMIIPKPNATPTDLLVKVISPCDKDSFAIGISCPGDGDAYPIGGSSGGGPGELICGYPSGDLTYYVIPVNGSPTEFGLYDFVYLDAGYSIPLPDNYYLSSNCPAPYKWFRIENGIIVEFGECDATFKYFVRRCGDGDAEEIVVLSTFPLTIGLTVSLSDPIYEGCRFEVTRVSKEGETPVALVVTQYETDCSSACVYYKVYNYDATIAVVNYKDCAGIEQTATIPLHSFIYLCALADSVKSEQKAKVIFESCQCPEEA